MSYNVKIDYETGDNIARAALLNAYNSLLIEYEQLISLENPENYQLSDLSDVIKHLKHVRKTYNYFSPQNEHIAKIKF